MELHEMVEHISKKYGGLSLEVISILCNLGHNATSAIICSNKKNEKLINRLNELDDRKKALFLIDKALKEQKIKNRKAIKHLEEIKEALIKKNEIIERAESLINMDDDIVKTACKVLEYCNMIVENLKLHILDFEERSIVEQLTIKTDSEMNKKIQKLFRIYKNYSKDDIVNAVIYEKAEQFIKEMPVKNILAPIENLESYIEDFEEAVKQIKSYEIDSVSEILKRLKSYYKMTYEDMGILLNCSRDTVKRTIHRKHISPKLRDNIDYIWELFCDIERMQKFIEEHKDKENFNALKILKLMETSEFKNDIAVEGITKAMFSLYISSLEYIILFFKVEMSPERMQIQNYVDETELIINNINGRNKTNKINLYKETVQKIEELQKKYSQYEKEDIIYELLLKQTDLYVTLRIDDSRMEEVL